MDPRAEVPASKWLMQRLNYTSLVDLGLGSVVKSHEDCSDCFKNVPVLSVDAA